MIRTTPIHWILKAAACVLILPLLLLSRGASADTPVRRFALVAGANDGGKARVQLRYANSDAMAVSRVLEDLGGVREEDRLLLADPSRADLQQGLATLGERLAQARSQNDRVELFVYYSGHSDEEGLLLGEEHVTYGELRQALESMPADVRVAILDSCSSGALTRKKGGIRRPPFLIDSSSRVQGHAYLTSSSADEAAQESDRIGASFFTHYLLSGLRGAADTSGDGKVTLTEAYQFAFQETLARTEKTWAGAQHPAYEMQLVGTGDLVMTDLRSTSAALVVDEAIGGRIFVRDDTGRLVVELRKSQTAPVELGLAPGVYQVAVDEKNTFNEAQVELIEGQRTPLARNQLRRVQGERHVSRGDDPPLVEKSYQRVPFQFTLVPFTDQSHLEVGFGLHLAAGHSGRLNGAELSLGVNLQDDSATGLQMALAGNSSGGSLHGAQLAVGMNLAGDDSEGVQLAVGMNVSGGDSEGAQLAVGMNHAGGDSAGVQLSVGFNRVDGDMEMLQSSVGGNWTTGSAHGGQIAVGANVLGGDLDGIQLAAGANIARGNATGLQASVGYNRVEKRLDGVQLSSGVNHARGLVDGVQIGLINLGGDINGAQIGLVNVATGSVDTQIGLVNYADEVDAPIGILSFVRKGQFHLLVWGDETGTGHLGVKLGSRYVYGILHGGSSLGERDGGVELMLGAGLGVHLPVERSWLTFVDMELLTNHVFQTSGWTDTGSLQTLRVYGGWRLAERLALVAGPSLNVWQSDEGENGRGFFGESVSLRNKGDSKVDLWPGFFVGMQY